MKGPYARWREPWVLDRRQRQNDATSSRSNAICNCSIRRPRARVAHARTRAGASTPAHQQLYDSECNDIVPIAKITPRTAWTGAWRRPTGAGLASACPPRKSGSSRPATATVTRPRAARRSADHLACRALAVHHPRRDHGAGTFRPLRHGERCLGVDRQHLLPVRASWVPGYAPGDPWRELGPRRLPVRSAHRSLACGAVRPNHPSPGAPPK